MSSSEEWLTTNEVAAVLRVHPKHVYRLLRQGLPARRVGGQWRFSTDEVLAWAAQGRSVGGVTSEHVDTNAGPALLAVESGVLNDALCAVLGADPGQVGQVTASPSEVERLLAGGVVQAGVVLGDEPMAFPTLRVHLAALPYGWVGTVHDGAVALPDRTSGAGVAMRHVAGLPESEPFGSEEQCVFAVAGGRVSAAFACGVWAERLGLPFHPLVSLPVELAVPMDGTAMRRLEPLFAACQREMGPAQTLGFADSRRCGEMRYVPAHRAGASTARPDARIGTRWVLLEREGAASAARVVDRLRERGLRVGGFLQVPCGPSDRLLGYDLVRLGKPDRVPLADCLSGPAPATGQPHCRLGFRPASLVTAFRWLQDDVSDADVLVVDGVGKLERMGQGHFPALQWVRDLARPMVVVLSARQDVLPAVRRKLSLSSKMLETGTCSDDGWVTRIRAVRGSRQGAAS
jgi:putative molybdopterin biosynthesis protein